MAHNHHSTASGYHRSFSVGVALNLIFIAVELFYGFIANSSALIADAVHNTGDVFGLLLSWIALWLAGKTPRKSRYSYGYKKSTILISVLNALILLFAVGFILWDALSKFKNPELVGGMQVMFVATIGVIINGFTALMFVKGQKKDLNIKAAFLHMAADALVSVGVIVSGILIYYTDFNWIDPLSGILIAILIIWGTWSLLIDSVNLALDAVPRNINIDEVRESLLQHPQITALHDLHIWALSTSENALSVHVISIGNVQNKLIEEIQELLMKKFHLLHTTIQIERGEEDLKCKTED